MQINLIPDDSVSSAPAGFTAMVQAAANVYQQDFPGTYTVNITYGWGTFDNQPNAELTNSNSGAFSLGGSDIDSVVSYATLKNWLGPDPADASLPTSNTGLPGQVNTFLVSSSQEKALGVYSGNNSAVDGSIGFNTADLSAAPVAFWEEAALQEIGHALGWLTGYTGQQGRPTVLDLFRYGSPGTHQWTGGQPAYFSLDGGQTDRADYLTSGDYTLFSNAGNSLGENDPFALPFTGDSSNATLTSLDTGIFDILGFQPAVSLGNVNADILLQNSNGPAAIWLMNGTSILGGGALATNPGPSWHLIGAAANAHGTADILWQNADGLPAVWDMNGSSIATAFVLPNPGTSWHIIAAADFNNDGNPDILWQNTDGAAALWEMNGPSIAAGIVLPDPGPTWHAIGAGDFNADGKADILWQNSDGLPAIWEMNGGSIVNAAVLPNPGSSWHAVTVGDFNNDGKADILWQNADGLPAIWEMNGLSILNAGVLPNPGSAWHAIGTSDFNGDGKADIVWQNVDGLPAVWEMNGLSIINAGVLPNPGTSWHVEDDGPIPFDQMASNATPQQSVPLFSAPDTVNPVPQPAATALSLTAGPTEQSFQRLFTGGS